MERRTFLLSACAVLAAPRPKPNVLFVAVDDLRPELGCYGNRRAISPSIDKLAASGTVFTRAYCQQAVCSPSRTSVLTGLRPDRTRVYDLVTHFRDTVPSAVTLPQWFRKHGYHAQSFGKIFHDGMDDPDSWSAPHWPARNAGMQYVDMKALEQGRMETLTWKKHESWQAPDVPDDVLQDGQTAERAVAFLRQPPQESWFLAIGFQKPHLPFVAPKRFFEMQTDVRPPDPAVPPDAVPDIALHPWTELRGYTDIPKTGSLTAAKTHELRRAYMAALSYMDAQFGKVINAVDLSNTVILVWGDHGFHLGEHNLWAKTTNFELDTRSPLIVRTPWQKRRGTRCAGLVELLDIYPTLVDLCGLPAASVDGRSFATLLDNPQSPGKQEAWSQFPRDDVMGYSVRTSQYRYTSWRKEGSIVAEELYDSPDERINRAGDPKFASRLAEARNRRVP